MNGSFAAPMDVLFMAATCLATYLAGSINFSIIASRLMKLNDPRSTGSGNPGATNLLRTGGAKIAIPVLLLDVSRGFIVTWGMAQLPFTSYWPLPTLFLLIGNIFPIFHGFKGGKGVATSVGVLLALSPVSLLFGLSGFLFLLAIIRIVSVSSLMLLTITMILMIVAGTPLPELATAITILLSVIYTHRHNLKRLFKGEEPPIWPKKLR